MNLAIPFIQVGSNRLYYLRTGQELGKSVIVTNKPIQKEYLEYQETFYLIKNGVNDEQLINSYLNFNEYITNTIQNRHIQIMETDDGLSNALVCSLFIYEKLAIQQALQQMEIYNISKPQDCYLQSLNLFSQIIGNNENQNQIEINNQSKISQHLSESIIVESPVFSQDVGEKPEYPMILQQSVQVESIIIQKNQQL